MSTALVEPASGTRPPTPRRAPPALTEAPTLHRRPCPPPATLDAYASAAYPVPLVHSGCAFNVSADGGKPRCAKAMSSERAVLPTDLVPCECERVMSQIRQYCYDQQPHGDLDLAHYTCM